MLNKSISSRSMVDPKNEPFSYSSKDDWRIDSLKETNSQKSINKVEELSSGFFESNYNHQPSSSYKEKLLNHEFEVSSSNYIKLFSIDKINAFLEIQPLSLKQDELKDILIQEIKREYISSLGIKIDIVTKFRGSNSLSLTLMQQDRYYLQKSDKGKWKAIREVQRPSYIEVKEFDHNIFKEYIELIKSAKIERHGLSKKLATFLNIYPNLAFGINGNDLFQDNKYGIKQSIKYEICEQDPEKMPSFIKLIIIYLVSPSKFKKLVMDYNLLRKYLYEPKASFGYHSHCNFNAIFYIPATNVMRLFIAKASELESAWNISTKSIALADLEKISSVEFKPNLSTEILDQGGTGIIFLPNSANMVKKISLHRSDYNSLVSYMENFNQIVKKGIIEKFGEKVGQRYLEYFCFADNVWQSDKFFLKQEFQFLKDYTSLSSFKYISSFEFSEEIKSKIIEAFKVYHYVNAIGPMFDVSENNIMLKVERLPKNHVRILDIKFIDFYPFSRDFNPNSNMPSCQGTPNHFPCIKKVDESNFKESLLSNVYNGWETYSNPQSLHNLYRNINSYNLINALEKIGVIFAPIIKESWYSRLVYATDKFQIPLLMDFLESKGRNLEESIISIQAPPSFKEEVELMPISEDKYIDKFHKKRKENKASRIANYESKGLDKEIATVTKVNYRAYNKPDGVKDTDSNIIDLIEAYKVKNDPYNSSSNLDEFNTLLGQLPKNISDIEGKNRLLEILEDKYKISKNEIIVKQRGPNSMSITFRSHHLKYYLQKDESSKWVCIRKVKIPSKIEVKEFRNNIISSYLFGITSVKSFIQKFLWKGCDEANYKNNLLVLIYSTVEILGYEKGKPNPYLEHIIERIIKIDEFKFLPNFIKLIIIRAASPELFYTILVKENLLRTYWYDPEALCELQPEEFNVILNIDNFMFKLLIIPSQEYKKLWNSSEEVNLIDISLLKKLSKDKFKPKASKLMLRVKEEDAIVYQGPGSLVKQISYNSTNSTMISYIEDFQQKVKNIIIENLGKEKAQMYLKCFCFTKNIWQSTRGALKKEFDFPNGIPLAKLLALGYKYLISKEMKEKLIELIKIFHLINALGIMFDINADNVILEVKKDSTSYLQVEDITLMLLPPDDFNELPSLPYILKHPRNYPHSSNDYKNIQNLNLYQYCEYVFCSIFKYIANHRKIEDLPNIYQKINSYNLFEVVLKPLGIVKGEVLKKWFEDLANEEDKFKLPTLESYLKDKSLTWEEVVTIEDKVHFN